MKRNPSVLGGIILLHFFLQADADQPYASPIEHQVVISVLFGIFCSVLNRIWYLEGFINDMLVVIGAECGFIITPLLGTDLCISSVGYYII